MRLAVDTNTLIGELLRERGQRYLLASKHELFTSDRVLSEARHELPRRVERMAAQSGLEAAAFSGVLQTALDIIEARVNVIPDAFLEPHADQARRLPRDPDDWPLVAVALLTGADIWTGDKDFLGCGLATWSTAVLHDLHPVDETN